MGNRKDKARTIKSGAGTKKLKAYDNEKRKIWNLEQKRKSERFLELQERFEELDKTELNELKELRIVHEKYTKRRADNKARQRKYYDKIRKQNKRFLELRDRFDKLNKKELKEYKECERAYECTKKGAADRKRFQTENRDKCREYRHKHYDKSKALKIKSVVAAKKLRVYNEKRVMKNLEQKTKSKRFLELQERFEELNETELNELKELRTVHEKYTKRKANEMARKKKYRDRIREQNKRFLELRDRFDKLNKKELKEYKECERAHICTKKAVANGKRHQRVNRGYCHKYYRKLQAKQREKFRRRLELQERFDELNEKELAELEECEEFYQRYQERTVKHHPSNKIFSLRDYIKECDKIRYQETIATQIQILQDHVKQIFALEERIDVLSDSELKELEELRSLGDINDLGLKGMELQELEECEKAYEQHEKEKLRKNERTGLVMQTRKIMVEKIFLRKQKLRLAELESQMNNLNEYELSELENLIKEENKQQIKVRPELDEMKEDLKRKSVELLELIEEKRRRIEIEGMEEEYDESVLEEIYAEIIGDHDENITRNFELFQEESESDESNKEELKLLKENIERRGRRTTRKLEAVKKSKLLQDSESEREMEIVKESNKERTSRLRKNTRNSKENVRKKEKVKQVMMSKGMETKL